MPLALGSQRQNAFYTRDSDGVAQTTKHQYRTNRVIGNLRQSSQFLESIHCLCSMSINQSQCLGIDIAKLRESLEKLFKCLCFRLRSLEPSGSKICWLRADH